jgi:hypothetical protein
MHSKLSKPRYITTNLMSASNKVWKFQHYYDFFWENHALLADEEE